MSAPRPLARGPFLLLVGSLLLQLAPAGCGERERAFVDTAEPADIERRVLSPAWDTLFTVGGRLDDTTLLHPTRMAADPEGVSVIDFGGRRVTRIDRTGRVRWTHGRRGSGPDEFGHPRDVKIGPRGDTWVLDVDNGRLTAIDGEGERRRTLPLADLGARADDFVPLPGGESLFLTMDSAQPLVRLSDGGEVLRRSAFPWPAYTRLPAMTAQMETASDPLSGRWAAAFSFGDGFFVFSGERWEGYRGRYAEPVRFAATRVRSGRSAGRTYTETRLRPEDWGALSIALAPDRLFILFAGRSEHRGRIVDTFAPADGRYLGSFLLPRVASGIAYADGIFYVLRRDPVPVLRALRANPAELP